MLDKREHGSFCALLPRVKTYIKSLSLLLVPTKATLLLASIVMDTQFSSHALNPDDMSLSGEENGFHRPVHGPPFPTPMEYAPGNPPPYPSVEPFRALALPEGKDTKKPPTEDVKALTAEDLKPSPDGSLELIDRSIKEMQDCKDVFEGLFKGIEKRRGIWPMDAVETELHEKVLALHQQSGVVLRSCKALRRNTRAFIDKVEKKLDDIASGGSPGGMLILSDEGLKKNGDELTSASNDMSKHVQNMLQRLQDLAALVKRAREHEMKNPLRKKVWEWLVRAFRSLKQSLLPCVQAALAPVGITLGSYVASHTSSILMKLDSGCKEDEGLGTVLEFLQTHIPEAAKLAEAKIKSFLAHQTIFRSPLGVGSVGVVGWMTKEEAERARNDWYHALVTLDTNEMRAVRVD